MCNWKSWFWPGLVTIALLTALTGWFLSGPVEKDLAQRAGDALKASQPWATVAFSGRDATLSGVAENDGAQAAAAKIASDTYGVRIADNQVSLPNKADPYLFSLIKDAAGVTLKGNYTSAENRAALVAAAEKAMPGIAIKDELTLATGKPEGFDALATFGVAQITDLSAGEVSLSNMDYSITGTPVDTTAYEKVSTATTALPAGAQLKTADLTPPTLNGPYEFSASVDGNAINLTGYAPTPRAKSEIEADAKAAFPAKTINNNLKIASGSPSNFDHLTVFSIGQLATLGNGSVALSDAAFSIKGTPADIATFDALMKSAKENLPAGATLAAADLVKPAEPVKPYVWSATATSGGVQLEGSVPSAKTAADALDLTKRRFIKTEVTDAQTILEGAPEGFAEAQGNLIKSLSYLSEGKATITDKLAKLEGTAPAQSIADLAAAKAKSGLPTGFELATNFKVIEPTVTTPATIALKPYVWSAISGKEGVKLTGSVLNADFGISIYDQAKSTFPDKTITNEQVPLSPSPAGFVLAQAEALKALSQLQEGSVNFADTEVTVSGIAVSDESKLAIISSLASELPQGYSVLEGDLSIAAASDSTPAPLPAVDCVAIVNALLSVDKINFATGKAIIESSSNQKIAELGSALSTCPDVRVEIGGHTDSDGNPDANQRLSLARAEAVRTALVATGVAAARMDAKGYGSTVPLAENDTPENKAKNRRTEFRSVQ